MAFGPSEAAIDEIVESCNGDLRGAGTRPGARSGAAGAALAARATGAAGAA